MAGRYFGIPFATAGDKVVVPDATQPDGSVSFTQGFGFDYERPNTDPSYKPVPRDGTNGLFHDITEALGIIQRQGAADWTVDAQPYDINAIVRHNDIVWRSLVINNNVTPVEGASWTQVGVASSETVRGLIEISTTAEAQGLTDDLRALTPKKLADVLGGGTLSTNGYGEIPLVIGGIRKKLIVQWGFESQSGNAMFSATFPIAFPSACLTLVMANYTGAAVGTGPFPFVCPIGAFTATGFNYQQANSATTGAYNMSYIAIGH